MAYSATITQWGNSQGLRLPKQLCQQLGVVVGQRVEVAAQPDGTIVVAPINQRYHRSTHKLDLKDLCAGVDIPMSSTEGDWGSDLGDEVVL